MTRCHLVGTSLVAWLVASGDARAAPPPPTVESPPLRGPAAEVLPSDVAVVLPAIPSFALPLVTHGAHSVREIRVAGHDLIGHELVVEGYVTWIYDCVAAVRKPGWTTARAQKLVDDDPTLCERPKLYLGATRDTPADRSLWVVDVPRPANKLEQTHLSAAELAARPPVPQVALGDFVAVTGTLALHSAHGETNSDGLIVYKSLAHPPAPPPGGASQLVARAPAPARPGLRRSPRVAVTPADWTASVRHLDEGADAASHHQIDAAIAAYEAALTAWPDNHLAAYGLGGVHGERGEWSAAVDAFARAIRLEPAEPMYNLWYGIALSEHGSLPEAVQFLAEAVRLDPHLWRAHYYLARIYRTTGHPLDAADQFGKAIADNPHAAAAYIALGELYRNWEHPDEAIAIEQQGTANVKPDARDASDLWVALGFAYEDKQQEQPAIAAYTKAIESGPDNDQARFQRGQAYFRAHDLAAAKRDLAAVSASTAPSLALAREQASKLLMEIANRPAGK